MKPNLLSRLKIQYKDLLYVKENSRPNLVKSTISALTNNTYIGDLKIREVIDLINLTSVPVNDYNFIWEMFNEQESC